MADFTRLSPADLRLEIANRKARIADMKRREERDGRYWAPEILRERRALVKRWRAEIVAMKARLAEVRDA